MKLFQLNAWGGRIDFPLIEMLKDEQADIVCLQEIISIEGPGALFKSLEEIAEYAKYPYVFFSPTFSYNFMNRTASFGNAILSKYPLSKQNTVFTNGNFQPEYDFDSDSGNIRNFQHAVITVKDQSINIINHHGYVIHEHKNGNEETDKQMQIIANYIEKLSGPVILTGDLNLEPNSRSLKPLNKILNNLSVKYNLSTTRTNLTLKTETCDYIFINDKVKINNFYAIKKVVSDHQALVLEFDL